MNEAMMKLDETEAGFLVTVLATFRAVEQHATTRMGILWPPYVSSCQGLKVITRLGRPVCVHKLADHGAFERQRL